MWLVGATAALHLGLAGGAAAGGPGRWEVVAQGAGVPSGSAQDLGLARGGDGVLHVAWTHQTAPLAANVDHRPISASGRLGSRSNVISGFVVLQAPALVVEGDGGLRVFVGGQRSTETEDPVMGLLTATAPATGAPWSEAVSILNRNGVHGRTVAATTAPDGVALQAWYGLPSDVIVHRGLSGDDADNALRSQVQSNELRPNLATDGGGAVWAAWCNLKSGLNVQLVDAGSGAPIGSPRVLAGSTSRSESLCVLESTDARRVAMAARAGGGVYVAGSAGFPVLDGVNVWRLDPSGSAGRPVRVARARGVQHSGPALAAAPDGRVWVGWVEGRGGTARLVARRSDTSGRVWGAAVGTRVVRAASLGAVNLSAQSGRLDALGLFQARSGSGSMRHTQLLPGLTLARRGRARRSGEDARITFRVSDAGDPVAGVRVRVGRESGLTAANGRVTLEVRAAPRRRLRAAATRSGFTAGRTAFRCC
jgi:hypothetical protein